MIIVWSWCCSYCADPSDPAGPLVGAKVSNDDDDDDDDGDGDDW